MATPKPKGSPGRTGKASGKGTFNQDRPMVRKATAKAPAEKVQPKFIAGNKTKSKNTNRSGGRTNGYPNGINPNPPTPEKRARTGPICGRPRTGNSSSGEGTCCNPAGARTPHLGEGPCWLHGGNLPTEVKKGELSKAKRAVVMFGLPIEVDPHKALLDELHFTAGHVEWLRVEIIQKMDNKEALRQVTDAGVEPSVWVAMYQSEREHLVKVAKSCIDAGVAERQVRMQEEQGRLLAMVIQAFIRDPELQLTPAQLVVAPKLLRRHLLSAPQEVSADQLLPGMPGATPAADPEPAPKTTSVIDV